MDSIMLHCNTFFPSSVHIFYPCFWLFFFLVPLVFKRLDDIEISNTPTRIFGGVNYMQLI